MESLRLVPGENVPWATPCCRCSATGQRWDRIAGKPYCPDCQEALARGEGEPLVERTEKRPCCICSNVGILPYLTLPLEAPQLVEMDLCAEHFRALLARRLGPHAYQQLARQLMAVQLNPNRVFLLHDAFYDPHGRALQPVSEEAA